MLNFIIYLELSTIFHSSFDYSISYSGLHHKD
jgi:hypothetical protein